MAKMDVISAADVNLEGIAILIIEDEEASPAELTLRLEAFGATVLRVSDIDSAIEALSSRLTEVIIASMDLVDERCIDMVRDYKARHPGVLFYLLTDQGYSSVESPLESVRRVVDDYIRRPLDAVRFSKMVRASLGRPASAGTSLAVVEPLVTKVKPYFLFRSSAMRRALARLPEIAASGNTVLISGETGVGKELVARAVHVLSPRASGPFVPINCGAIPEGLIEGELFGHEKGAFTGAFRTRKGKFETAANGTLFLDEIGDMPLNLQVRLLRVLEDGKVYRVGGESAVPVNVRVIAATRIELEKAVEDGLFREDLYYRLNVLRLSLPPLRERVEDVSLLAVHFLERAFGEMGRVPPYPSLSAETIHLLEQCLWRGNVRELRNVMTRVATLMPKDTPHVFPMHVLPHLERTGGVQARSMQANEVGADVESPGGKGLFIPAGTPLDKAEEMLINDALMRTGGNRTKAAKLLGIGLRTLRRKINRV